MQNMARPLRLEFEGAYYHVTSRGNQKGWFKGIIVDKETYLMVLTRYIHLNPVRAGIVKQPEDYRWTSYREYIDAGKITESIVDITV